jgi:hypothetical protein
MWVYEVRPKVRPILWSQGSGPLRPERVAASVMSAIRIYPALTFTLVTEDVIEYDIGEGTTYLRRYRRVS